MSSRNDFPVVEIFGYPPDNHTSEAEHCRKSYRCPFVGGRCTKGGHQVDIPLGTCAVTNAYGPVITCPKRFYGNGFSILGDVATELFRDASNVQRLAEVGPNQTYSLDWVLVKYDSSTGTVADYHGVEVQAMDITGSVRPYFEAYMSGTDWSSLHHPHGINWSNVFKRLLPQFLAKGAMLQSYGKKLAIVVQDKLMESVDRSDRMVFEEEPNPDLANLLFFVYAMHHDRDANVHRLSLSRILRTSSRRLETSFIAGLLGGRVPQRAQFESLIQGKLAKILEEQ